MMSVDPNDDDEEDEKDKKTAGSPANADTTDQLEITTYGVEEADAIAASMQPTVSILLGR